LGEEDHEELFVSTRGAFIKRMVAAGFGVPMIGTFGFTELAAACRPQQSFGNQTQSGYVNNPPHGDQGPPQHDDQGPPQHDDQGPPQNDDQGPPQHDDRDSRGRDGH
jgi:hypothetical protein